MPTIPQPTVIYPLEVLDEYKDLPENKASLRRVLYDSFGGDYTSLGQYSHAMLSAVQIDLTRNIAKTLNTLNDEVKFAFDQNIGTMKDWQAVVLEPKILRIIALLNGRVLVGLPLSRDEKWIEATTQYTATSYKFGNKLKGYPWGTRWAVGPFIYRTDVKPHQDAVAGMLKPLIEQQMARHAKSVDDDDAEVEAGEMIGWTMSYYKPGEMTYHRIALDQLMISFSSIHTSTVTLMHAIYDLAARPEYAEPLREEIRSNSVNGKLDKHSIAQLKKLDSFIKESQRLNPQTACKHPPSPHSLLLLFAYSRLSGYAPENDEQRQAIRRPQATQRHDNRSIRLAIEQRASHRRCGPIRRLPLREDAGAAGQRAEVPAGQHRAVRHGLWLRGARLSGPLLRHQRDEDNLRLPAAELRHQAPGRPGQAEEPREAHGHHLSGSERGDPVQVQAAGSRPLIRLYVHTRLVAFVHVL